MNILILGDIVGPSGREAIIKKLPNLIKKKNLDFVIDFNADPKLLQFVSIGVAPAGVLAGVAFIMSKHYGSKPIGGLIIVGGVILFSGMIVCNILLEKLDDKYITTAVAYLPTLFMVLSAPVFAFGGYLIKHKKTRPRKRYF